MKRRVMTIDQIRSESAYYLRTGDRTAGVMALVDVENMGWCKDGVTRWYTFYDEDGNPAIYFKH